MASLTKTSVIARKTIRFSIYGVILLIIGRFVIGTGIKIFRYFFPEPPPPPTVAFGKLPTLPLPEKTPGAQDLVFTLETAAGRLPEFTDQLPVYFMSKPTASFQDLELAQQKAVALGFGRSGRELVKTVFIFQHLTSPATLTMNIVSGIFSISYDLRANPQATEKIPPNQEVAAKQVKAYLSRADLLKEDLTGPVTHEFIKIEEGRFVPALSLSESDLIKINIYRKNFDDLPTVTQKEKQANVWFMLSGSELKGDQVIAAEYHYYSVDEERYATYPIKTAQEAWDELNSGRGYIINLGDNQNTATIRQVYLAYFDPGQYVEYYQPVVVFEGDNDFVAYVPAVTDEFYGSE